MADKVLVGKDGELLLSAEQRERWGLSPGASLLVRETPEGVLIRRADSVLRRVYVEPTSLCNLSCRTCVRHSWDEPPGSLSIHVYRRLIRDLGAVPTLRKISLWGFGEPLLHPHIVEMVALAKGIGAETELITNGLLLTPTLAERLVAAGLDTIVVSVDGVSPESYSDVRAGADFRLVQDNVLALRYARESSPRRNPEVGLEFVAMRRNVDQLPRLRHLAYTMGASFVVVTNVLPYTKELSDEILYGMFIGKVSLDGHGEGTPEILLPSMDVRHVTREPLSRLLEEIEGPVTQRARLLKSLAYCRFVGEGAVAVAWNGDVSPCVALMHSYTCYILGREKHVRRYALGNIGGESIKAIWGREEYARFRSRVQEFDFSPCSACGGCHLSETNEEDCFGNKFPVCGDCLWARGVIQCP
ncbi:MAG: radical SAM protein [Dehalococcoidales bacterium]|nr:radical SAM protein [Dehalococcoidales bacterium]